MSQTAVLVWVSASALLPTFRADVSSFAQSRLLRFEAPRENSSAVHASAYAPDAVLQVEGLLEEARNARASLELSHARTAIERALPLLREHPELPQSAWLMAEALELSAEVESSTPDGAEAARALERRARALEGPRAATFGSGAAPVLVPQLPSAEAPLVVEIEGLEASDVLEWDGIESEQRLSTTAGEHHVRVSRNGRLMWAGWTTALATQPRLRLPVPELVPCSGDDLAAGHFAFGRAVPPPHARCMSYVLARARPGGGIEVALCERARCEPVVAWDPGARVVRSSAGRKPIWPYVVAASAGALAITGVALWRFGAFDRAEAPSKEVWVWSGQQALGLRF